MPNPDITSGLVPKPEPGSLQELALSIRQRPEIERKSLTTRFDDADLAAYYLQHEPALMKGLNPKAQAIAKDLLDNGNISNFYGQFGRAITPTSLANVPAFLQPTLKKYNARVRMGDPFTDDAAHVTYLEPTTIRIDRPDLLDQPELSHEATHVFQNTLAEPPTHTWEPNYDYGDWNGLLKARAQGKTIRAFTDEQQAEMIEQYQRLQGRVRDVAAGKSKEDRKSLLAEWDLAQRAAGPYIKQLAGLPEPNDEFSSIDVKKAFPPPGPPPASLTGQAVPLPEMGGGTIDLNAGLVPKMSKYARPGYKPSTLDPTQEKAFQKWVKTNRIPSGTASGRPDPTFSAPDNDYDMRGYWKALQAGNPLAKQAETNKHFPDIWKTPYHQSFSNESIYATPDAPHWKGNTLIDKTGNVVFNEDAPQ